MKKIRGVFQSQFRFPILRMKSGSKVLKGAFLTVLLGLVLNLSAFAQNAKVLPSEPQEFIEEFESRISKFVDKAGQDYLKSFREHWETGKYTKSEQDVFINQTNVMLLKNYVINGEVLGFAKAFELIKSDTAKAQIDADVFFKVNENCIQDLNRTETGRFLNFIIQFVGSGTVVKNATFNWRMSQTNPELKYATKNNPETGKDVHFPYLVFDNTDLIFKSAKDSTRIAGTKGEMNIMNKMFIAEGGRLNWSKLDLDPNDVYADVMKYTLNLNYSNVDIDTVVFHYNSLISVPLKGKYEDSNKGYSDINKANYPYFRSYDGGVVIENFIKNVRYEGGFSLRGVRKIGSAYFKWVDKPEEKVKPPKKEEIDNDVVEDNYEEDFGYKYDESAYYFDDDEIIEDTYGEDDPEEYESDDPTEGSDFESFDMAFLDKDLVLFKAQLTIFRNGEPAMNLRALEFVLDLEKLVSKRTEVAIYLSKEDSITHPSLDVIYDVDSAEITLMKDVKDKKARQAFLSPHHNFYLYYDALKWKQNTDIIELTSIIDKDHQISAIESKDFYKYQRWNQFKGVLAFNPMGAIYRYSTLFPDNPLTPAAICEENGRPDETEKLIMAMPDVEGSGFVTYDRVTGIITPLPKLMDWAKAARGRKDYDAIQIISQVKSGNNAEIDLKTKEIDMKGVAYFPLSDSQFVRVQPNQQRVTIKKDRDLQFDGIVAAGKLNFYGRLSTDTVDGQKLLPGKFTFQYENYKVLVDSLDSLRFILVRGPEANGQFSPLQKALRATTIEGVTGAIYINKPTNKNGLESHPEYPVFDSYTKSFIYWAKEGIHNGVYTKDKLYFSIDPFVLDSLEDFNERALSFEGEFYSSGVFPKIRQKLSVMEDNTLGMSEITPDTGYATYEGAGRFIGEVKLDGSGLSSKGEMQFLHTVANSDSFQMFFDSVKAVTNEFNMPGGEHDGAYFPEIKAAAVNYKWLTKKDEIELETLDKGEAIVMFGGQGTFEGKLVITKEGLRGSGKVTLGNVEVESDDIIFGENDFEANSGTFTVVDPQNPSKKVFVARDSKINYDVSKHHSSFVSNTPGVPNAAFPGQKYRTSLGKGEFDRGTNDVKLESLSPKASDNYFLSYDPAQDSLVYNAKSAHYNLDQQKIEIDGVPYIYVADAKITPEGGKVEVKETGMMQKLDNAQIDANQVTNYHKMYEAKVEITSSKQYSGSSKYDYIEFMGKKQYINLVEMRVQGDTMTTAKGEIKEEQAFYLTDRIFFKGSTYLEANNKFLRFTGEVKIDSEDEFFADKWFKFNDVVNPDSVFVEITKEQLGQLVVGLHYIKRNRIFYSTFLGTKKNKDDIDVALIEGGLTYDTKADEFKIGSKKKLTGIEYRGATSSLNDKENIITTVGRLALPLNFGKNTIDMELAGKWRDDAPKREISTDLVGNFQFGCIPKEAWAKLSDKASVVLAINNTIDWEDPIFRQGIAEFLDPKEKEDKNMQEFLAQVAKAQSQLEVKPSKMIPGSILLSGIGFRFDIDFKSLWYSGEVGVLGFNQSVINKYSSSNSKIEYARGKYTPAGLTRPDTLRMYLEFDEANWVFYEFYGEVLYTISSDIDGYNAVLRAEKDKRKKNEGYRFELADESQKDAFVTNFVNKYIWRTTRPSGGFLDDDGGGDDGGDDDGGGDDGGNDGGGDGGKKEDPKKEGGIIDDGMGGDEEDEGKEEGGVIDDGMGGDDGE